MSHKINEKQKEALFGLFLHCYGVYHHNQKADFEFYAKKLDELKVPFTVQNLIAQAAENRDNYYLYFSTVLKNNDIKVTHD